MEVENWIINTEWQETFKCTGDVTAEESVLQLNRLNMTVKSEEAWISHTINPCIDWDCAHIFCATSASTYSAAIPQWPPDFLPASMNSDRPMRLMVGAMARGPMYLSTTPTSPEKPRKIWSSEDTRMAPWICGGQRRTKPLKLRKFSRKMFFYPSLSWKYSSGRSLQGFYLRLCHFNQ